MRMDINKVAVAITCVAIISAALYGIMRPYRYSANTDRLGASAGKFLSSLPKLEEAESFDASANETYWLNSGAFAYLDGTTSVGTLRGDAEKGSRWQTEYMKSNPIDTDNGVHPQNLFRLFTKADYGDGTYQAYFKIKKTILSPSPNRNASNGVLIMIHATDNDDLYYAGLRVDGTAVIKKKIGGIYHTLGEVPVFAFAKYDRDTVPNLLPLNVLLGVQTKIKSWPNDQVDITLSIDIGASGIWVPVLHAVDAPKDGVPTLPLPAHAGLRTDFMEVEMRNFMITSL